jgi:hypothetical protein
MRENHSREGQYRARIVSLVMMGLSTDRCRARHTFSGSGHPLDRHLGGFLMGT